MPKDFSRTDRVSQQMQRELAETIRHELKDPRIGMVTITDVEVTRDYSHAKVFFTVLGDDAQKAESLETLNRSAGFLRSQVSHQMKLRIMPQLHFVYDESVERGVTLSNLIDKAVSNTAIDDDESEKPD